jgi:DNA-binding winged helix-turn-helix (wHTH) protein
MDVAKRATDEALLTTAELAAREDFTIGGVIVSPSTRSLRGPAGTCDIEPRVMQVLVVLADAGGQVVTRESLFNRCWGGVFVGDDSLNRAVAAVRRAAETVGGRFELETIPRTGYRLTIPDDERVNGEDESAVSAGRLSRRRALVAGGALAALGAGGSAVWLTRRWHETSQFDALMAQGEEAFRNGSAFENSSIGANSSPRMIHLYEQAVRLRPDSARAWGLLGYFKSAASAEATGESLRKLSVEAPDAIRRAFSLDPKEPYARVGMYLLQGLMFDWAERDRMLRAILADDPTNLPAMIELMPLLQAAGLTRESWLWNERLLKASPFLRPCLVVRAFKLWILGNVREADNVIDRVRSLWPDFEFGNYARLVIFALTGRVSAARAMLDNFPSFRGDGLTVWQVSLDALETRAPDAVERARTACIDAARRLPALANDTVMLLGALGLADDAFAVTEGFLLWRGKLVSAGQGTSRQVDGYSRRMTQWMFTPPLAAMRADPRFAKLCDDFGLTAYWRARGVKPDYLAFG